MATIHTEHSDVVSREEILIAGDTYSVGLYGDNGAVFNVGSGGTVSGVGAGNDRALFSDNSATGHGGAIYSVSGVLDLGGVDFRNNNASANGGAVYALWGGATVDDVIFAGNTAVSNGGAVWNGTGTTITGATFSGNTAGYRGGAIFNDDNTALSLTDSLIVGNRSGSFSGALHLMTNAAHATVSIAGNTFADNFASSHGGVVFNQNDDAVLSGNTFSGNRADGTGGVVYN
ncbi:MAG: hypothetical protein MR051_00580, partial [Lentisphaeria bacterium]|nr:hypothetical protein [Lentisphaeria bacterium]